MGFEMSPHILHRIEFGRIGRQSFDDNPSSSGSHVVLDQTTAMNRCAIPDDQQFARHMPFEMTEKLDRLGALDAAGVDLEIEAPESQPPDDRKAFPIERLVQQRGLSAWRPGACPRGAGAQSTFVDEDDGSPLLTGLFFKAGQTTRFQRRIAFSSRSTARRSGRWQLNPLSPSKRQT